MGSKHIAELLIEANKKISQITNTMENDDSSEKDHQAWIDDLNAIIRQLDHIVESLEKN
jgi:exonuclease VII small subunit